ncbi:MAG: LEA type 2 family protein [Bacteroidia bacterium]|nr:LEA type 2 family protein [Bacteroidia bacterium]
MKSLVFLFSFFCLFACAPLKEVECSGVKGFSVKKVDLSGIEGELLLEIKNPNRYKFVIYPTEFDIVYSGVNLGKAQLAKKVKVKGNVEEVYGFNLKKEFKDVSFTEVLKLLNGGSRGNMIEVKGDLKIGRFLINKKIPIDIKEKVKLN